MKFSVKRQKYGILNLPNSKRFEINSKNFKAQDFGFRRVLLKASSDGQILRLFKFNNKL